MDDRIQEIHCCICNKRTIDQMMPGKFATFVEDLLVSGLQKQREDHSLGLRERLLQILSLLKLLFDMETENMKFIEKLKNINILNHLLNASYSECLFLSYTASKALYAAIRNSVFKNEVDPVLLKIATGVLKTDKQLYNLRHLQQFMSNRMGLNVNRMCFDVITTSQIFSVPLAESLMVTSNAMEKQLVYASLVQKAIKFINKMDEKGKLSSIENVFLPISSILVGCLANKLRLTENKERIVCKKLLDVFNCLFQYGTVLAKVKDIDNLYKRIVHHVTNGINSLVLMSVQFVRGGHAFTGTYTVEDHSSHANGDLAFLRKLLLVFIKSCAVLSRRGGDATKDEAQISQILTIVTKMMYKFFPETKDTNLWLPLVFGEQDDSWIEVLLCLFDCHAKFPQILHLFDLGPHDLFLQFTEANTSDHMLIIDLLTSPETSFLVYFIRYLKYMLQDWNGLVKICHRKFSDAEYSTKQVNGNALVDYSDSDDTEDEDMDENGATGSLRSLEINYNIENEHLLSTRVQVSNLSKQRYAQSYISEDTDNGTIVSPVSEMHSVSDICRTACVEDISTKTFKDKDKLRHEDVTCGADSQADDAVIGNLSFGGRNMDSVMSTLIRVRLHIEKLSSRDLFPYNPKPLLTLLLEVEDLYEGMDYNL